MPFCNACGQTVSENDRTCGTCGAEQPGLLSASANTERSFSQGMTLDEIQSLFNKLHEDETDVLCAGELFGVGFALAGKVTKSDAGQVEITSDQGSFVQLSLTSRGFIFGYQEPRDCPEFAATLSESARTAMALTIKFPDRGLTPRPERVFVVERRFSSKSSVT